MTITFTNSMAAIGQFWQQITSPLDTEESCKALKSSCLWSVVGTFVVSGGNPVFACIAGVISVASSCFSICALTEIKEAAATHKWIDNYRFVLVALPSVVTASTAYLTGYPLFLPKIWMIWELLRVAHANANQHSLAEICKPRSVPLLIF